MTIETPDQRPQTGNPMGQTLSPIASPILAAPDFEAAVVQHLPAWWRQGQQEAWNQYQERPFPHGKNEQWRFASTSKLKLEGYQVSTGVSAAAREEIEGCAKQRKSSWGLAFANDHLQYFHQPSTHQHPGLILCTLQQALHRYPELVQRYFMTQNGSLGGEKFAALHRAHCQNGLFLYLPKGVELSEPIEVSYWLTEATAASFPHNLVIAEAHSKADLRFYYRSTEAANGGFLGGVSEFHVGAGANLRNVHVQRLSEVALSWQQSSTVVERDGRSTSLHLNLGGSYSRLENTSRLVGPGAHSEMLSLTASHQQQEFDQRTFQEHASDHTVSDLLYKNALDDDSRTIFAGMIDVDPNAQQTNAYQSNRNLLLSSTAEADSLPGLEIMANDVRCTHGSTIGQIDQEELFYLLQRGITPKVARRLFVVGFFDEVLTRLNDPQLCEELHALVESKYNGDPVI